MEFAAFVREYELIELTQVTVTHAVCTLRCWTLSLLRFERERMHRLNATCLRDHFAQ